MASRSPAEDLDVDVPVRRRVVHVRQRRHLGDGELILVVLARTRDLRVHAALSPFAAHVQVGGGAGEAERGIDDLGELSQRHRLLDVDAAGNFGRCALHDHQH